MGRRIRAQIRRRERRGNRRNRRYVCRMLSPWAQIVCLQPWYGMTLVVDVGPVAQIDTTWPHDGQYTFGGSL